MAILLDEKTPVIVQGFTGRIASFHAEEMSAYGTNIVGGVTPGKGGMTHLGRPVFDTVKEAVRETDATASIIFVPAAYAADSITEAVNAGLKQCVAITEGIPIQDMMRVKRYIRCHEEDRIYLIGPNCAGIISPNRAMLGIMPGHIYKRGTVGVVARSGTLSYEAASQMQEYGIGISTSVGIGGDPLNGSSFKEILAQFEADPETKAVMLIGEIGGPQEAEAAEFIRHHMSKPVVAFIAGRTAPKGQRMGHAGAVIASAGESAAEKVELLRAAGATIAPTPAELGSTMAQVLGKKPLKEAAG